MPISYGNITVIYQAYVSIFSLYVILVESRRDKTPD